MTSIFQDLESTRRNEAVSLTLAAGVHALLLLWNPILLKSDFRAMHDFVTVDVVEEAGSPLLSEKPKRMSFLETLKDMLMTPKADAIAHPSPSLAQRIAAPLQPLLKEAARVRPISMGFLPHTQTEDVAAMRTPDQIQSPGPKNPALPLGVPALKSKSFGGIRLKDLPFQVSGPESITANNVSAVPIAIGNSSAKSGLGYAAPALQESKHHTLGLQPGAGLLGGRGEAPALATGVGAPAQIALAGTGGAGTAPTGTATGGGNLQERGGGSSGGLVSRALMGVGGGGTGGLGQIPTAAQQLDTQIGQANPGHQGLHKAFELAGPLINRGILRKVIPQYPGWAEEQGIMGSVRLYFTVDSQGKVRSTIRVTKTTGYPQLDQLGIDALKQWSFAPLSSAEEGTGQWGIITFNFSLSS